jgi:hypothetical protein
LTDTWSVLVAGGTIISPVREAAQFPQKRVLSGFSKSHFGHFTIDSSLGGIKKEGDYILDKPINDNRKEQAAGIEFLKSPTPGQREKPAQ